MTDFDYKRGYMNLLRESNLLREALQKIADEEVPAEKGQIFATLARFARKALDSSIQDFQPKPEPAASVKSPVDRQGQGGETQLPVPADSTSKVDEKHGKSCVFKAPSKEWHWDCEPGCPTRKACFCEGLNYPVRSCSKCGKGAQAQTDRQTSVDDTVEKAAEEWSSRVRCHTPSDKEWHREKSTFIAGARWAAAQTPTATEEENITLYNENSKLRAALSLIVNRCHQTVEGDRSIARGALGREPVGEAAPSDSSTSQLLKPTNVSGSLMPKVHQEPEIKKAIEKLQEELYGPNPLNRDSKNYMGEKEWYFERQGFRDGFYKGAAWEYERAATRTPAGVKKDG